MATLVWRVRVKTIAILELIFLCFEICMAAIIACFLFFSHVKIDYNREGEAFDRFWNASIFFGLVVIMISIGIFAAVKLLRSSDQGRDPRKSLEAARIWKNVTIVFGIITFIVFIAFLSIVSWLYTIIPLAVTIIWRSGCLYIVNSFIKELNDVIASRYTEDPIGPFDDMIEK